MAGYETRLCFYRLGHRASPARRELQFGLTRPRFGALRAGTGPLGLSCDARRAGVGPLHATLSGGRLRRSRRAEEVGPSRFEAPARSTEHGVVGWKLQRLRCAGGAPAAGRVKSRRRGGGRCARMRAGEEPAARRRTTRLLLNASGRT